MYIQGNYGKIIENDWCYQVLSLGRVLTTDSIEGREFLHDQWKLLHEKHIEYAHRVIDLLCFLLFWMHNILTLKIIWIIFLKSLGRIIFS